MSTSQEQSRYIQISKEISEWWQQPRWKNVERPYTAGQIAALRPTLQPTYPSNYLSQKLFSILQEAQQKGEFHATFGALDPIQAVNLCKYFTTMYVSGWQCSSTASTTNDPGPDFADYPYDTVPQKVDQLFRALQFHDKKQNQARSIMTLKELQKNKKVDYLCPMIADADAGFGGITVTMKLVKLFIEAGAAGIHLEDQRAGTKKCGHMAGKVIVSTREIIERLIAARVQSDIMGCELMILARTDALGAKLLDSNADIRDQEFIYGIGPGGEKMCYVDAGVLQISNNWTGTQKEKIIQQWKEIAGELGLNKAKQWLKTNYGLDLEFEWESTRTEEGYYQVKGCVEFCAKRANIMLRIADMVWMETSKPNLEVAKHFANLVHKVHPNKFLGYNCSPSFNWSAAGMTDEEIKQFQANLGKLGFNWQFITLAGFHLNALKSEQMCRAYSEQNMLGYVQNVQRKEQKHHVDQLTHQKWSGSEYADAIITMVSNNPELASQGSESTEHQFGSRQ